MVGQIAYFAAKGAEGLLARVTGKVVETKGDTVVVATRPCDVKGIPNHLLASAPGDHTEITFLRIPASSCVYSRPPVWLACDPGQLPDSDLCLAAWGELGQEVLAAKRRNRTWKRKVSTPEPKSPALLEDLGRFKGMFQARDSEKDSSDSEGLALQKVSRKHQPPGGVSSSSRELPSVQKKSSRKNASHHDMMQTLLGKGISEGQEPSRPHALPDDELHDGPALQGVEEKPSGTEADQEASAEDLFEFGLGKGNCGGWGL